MKEGSGEEGVGMRGGGNESKGCEYGMGGRG